MGSNAKVALKRIDFFNNCDDKDSREAILDKTLEVGELIVKNGYF
jgi:hypothetical protein